MLEKTDNKKEKAEDKLKPKWIIIIAEDKDIRHLNKKDKKMVRDFYLDFRRQGISSIIALEKAKKILACFHKGGANV